jgi:hypothetical protein
MKIGELVERFVDLSDPSLVDQASGSGLGQEHWHGTFRGVGPVRPPLVSHRESGPRVTGNEAARRRALARPVMIKNDRDPAADQLGYRSMEEQTNPHSVGVLRAHVDLDQPMDRRPDLRAERRRRHDHVVTMTAGVGTRER